MLFLDGEFCYSIFIGFGGEFLAVKFECYLFVFKGFFAVFECCLYDKLFGGFLDCVFFGFEVLLYLNEILVCFAFVYCSQYVGSRL